jgi:hypothetical protein
MTSTYAIKSWLTVKPKSMMKKMPPAMVATEAKMLENA